MSVVINFCPRLTAPIGIWNRAEAFAVRLYETQLRRKDLLLFDISHQPRQGPTSNHNMSKSQRIMSFKTRSLRSCFNSQNYGRVSVWQKRRCSLSWFGRPEYRGYNFQRNFKNCLNSSYLQYQRAKTWKIISNAFCQRRLKKFLRCFALGSCPLPCMSQALQTLNQGLIFCTFVLHSSRTIGLRSTSCPASL